MAIVGAGSSPVASGVKITKAKPLTNGIQAFNRKTQMRREPPTPDDWSMKGFTTTGKGGIYAANSAVTKVGIPRG